MFDSLKSCLNIVSVANHVLSFRYVGNFDDSFSVLDFTLIIISFETSHCDSNISIKYWLKTLKTANSLNYMTL